MVVKNEMVEEAQAVFCEAMCQGWAGGASPLDNRTTFKKGLWRVEDQWVIGNNGFSAGWTTQFLESSKSSTAFWQMHYEGVYPKILIPYVRRATLINYRTGCFYGGRGPGHVEMPSEGQTIVYRNTQEKLHRHEDPAGAFSNFCGMETVERFFVDGAMTHPAESGWHRVSGMRLMYL